MDFFELIKTRQSVRSFETEKPVEKEKIIKCLEAARLTPSACNSQTWHFTVCTGDKAKEIAACCSDSIMNKWAFEAPFLLLLQKITTTLQQKLGQN